MPRPRARAARRSRPDGARRITIRRSSPAASSSGSRSRARSPTIRRSCWPTSRRATSTRTTGATSWSCWCDDQPHAADDAGARDARCGAGGAGRRRSWRSRRTPGAEHDAAGVNAPGVARHEVRLAHGACARRARRGGGCCSSSSASPSASATIASLRSIIQNVRSVMTGQAAR